MNLEFGNNRQTWTIVCILACIVMALIATADLFFPKPSLQKELENRSLAIKAAEKNLNDDRIKLEQLENEESGIWEGAQEVVTPKILQEVTKLATANNVNLKSFRPQTPVSDGDTIRAHFVVLVDAKFPAMAKFIQGLESNSSRIGLNVVQISSSDQESDQVSATLGIVAFIKAPVVEPAERSSGNATQEKAVTSKTPQPSNRENTNGSKE